MRTIKFRGKRLDNFEWVYGDLLLNNGCPIIVIQVNRDYIGTTDVGAGKHWHIETPAYRVDINTTGQFTGLHDKNGKEIYEGDFLVSPFTGEPVPVIYDREYCQFTFGGAEFGVEVKHKNLEVIGNIYENPEYGK